MTSFTPAQPRTHYPTGHQGAPNTHGALGFCSEDWDWCQTLRQCSDGNSEAEGLEPSGKEEPRTNLLSPHLWSLGDPKSVGCTVTVPTVSSCPVYFGNFHLHTSLHPHCIAVRAWYPPCLSHKLPTRFKEKTSQIPPIVPLMLDPGPLLWERLCVCQRGEVQGTQGKPGRHGGQVKENQGCPTSPGWECRMEKGNWGPGVWVLGKTGSPDL